MRFSIRPSLIAAVTACSLLMSCANPVEPRIAGAWELSQRNGGPLPSVLETQPQTRVLTNGVLLIYPDGVYTYDYTLRILATGSPARTEAVSEEGTWERKGHDLTLTRDGDGVVVKGTHYGPTLRLNFGADVHDFSLVMDDPTLWQKGGT